METKEKGRLGEYGLVIVVFAIAFLIVLGVSFALKAALSFLEQKSLAKQNQSSIELACNNQK